MATSMGHGDGLPHPYRFCQRTRALRLTLGLAACLAPVPALAQQSAPLSHQGSALRSQQGTNDISAAPAVVVASPTIDTEHLFNFTKPLAPIGKQLSDLGIYANGYVVNTIYDNAAGGNERASQYFGRVVYGLDFDLNKLIGLPGASVRLQINTKYGGSPSGENYASGSLFGYLTTQGPNNLTNLADFTYHQTLFNDHLHLLVGRTSMSDYFATSPQYCQFEVGLCQNLTAFTYPFNDQAPFQPIATWAGAVAVLPTPHTYLRAGASADNPNTYFSSDFPWDKGWSLRGSTGVFVPVEAGYATTPYEARFAGRYSIGYTHDTADNFDPVTFANIGGSDAVYAQAQQIVWRPDPKSERAIHLLAGATLNTTHNTSISNSIFGAVFIQGPLPKRPDDIFAFKVQHYELGGRYINSLNSQIRANGGTGTVASSEQIIEVDYGISLAPGVQFKPFAYYTVHPDQLVYGEQPRSNIKDAIGIGAQLFISLNYAFGLPAFNPPS